MNTRQPRQPKYRRHKPSGQALVEIGGDVTYLGPYNSTASKEEYDRLIVQWLANGRKALTPAEDLTVLALTVEYTRFADGYYVNHGRQTREAGLIRESLRVLNRLYAPTPACEFGPKGLKAVRQAFIDDGYCRRGRHLMSWFRVSLTAEEQRVVDEERTSHPNERIRERMLMLWLLHNGLTRQKAAEIVGVGRATVQRYVAAYREGGLDGLRRWDPNRPVSEMAAYCDLIRESFEKQPACTIAEACDRIFQLTGLKRGPSQVRKFLKDLGLKWQRIRAIPVPPKKLGRARRNPNRVSRIPIETMLG